MATIRAASLGQLAVHTGVLPEEARLRLTEVMRTRVRAGQPVSFGRLLLRSGLDVEGLHALLARGASFLAVRCDACGEECPQKKLMARREHSCGRCGALLLGFAPFAGGIAETLAFRQVLPLPTPAAPVPERTIAFGDVLGVPQSAQVTMDVPAPHSAEASTDHYVLPSARGARTEQESAYLLSLITHDDRAPNSRTSSSELPFTSVGGFRLLKAIGEGGMGKVYLAEGQNGQQVALKLIHADRARGTTALERFRREAEALSQVRHPHVVQVIDHGQDPATGVHYLALEYLAGGSLVDKITRDGPLRERAALRIGRGIAKALEAAVELGVVHRDVKPGNVLLTADGQPKLADLGLIKQVEGGIQITATGLVMGTPAFMSPEQASGDRNLDVRTDLYALGCCLYQVLTGNVPFVEEGLNIIDIVRRRLKEDLPDVRLTRPEISGATAQIVRWLTARDRQDRYPTPARLIRDIERVLQSGDALGPDDHRLGGEEPPLDPTKSYPIEQSAIETAAIPAQGRSEVDTRLLVAIALVLVFLTAVLIGVIAG